MRVTETKIPGVMLIEPRVFPDDRGFFLETYQAQRYNQAGIDFTLLQTNHSRSSKGTLRGLHYQITQAQQKIAFVTRGEIFDVAVDLRSNSATYGEWVGAILNDQNHHQLYIPKGCAHGYYVLSEEADFFYLCSDYYHPKSEWGIAWDDADIGIDWPLDGPPLTSDKDKQWQPLKLTSKEHLP